MSAIEKPEEAAHTSVLVVQKPESQQGDDTSSTGGKLGPDGKTLLIPQPSDDPEG